MLDTLNFEIETKKVSAKGEFEGYGALFNLVDNGGDVIQKGAFAASLGDFASKGRAPKMLWQHDPATPIGVYTEVREDDRGLYVKGQLLLDTVSGKEAYIRLKSGAVDGLSIGYRTREADFTDEGLRVLKQVDLWEISLVTFPMNPDTRVDAVKALDAGKSDPVAAQLNNALAAMGIAPKDAAAASAAAIKSLVTGRSGGDEVAELRALLRARASA